MNWRVKLLTAAVVFFVIATVTASAETQVLTAPEALEKLEAGSFVVLDIRSPEEWAESGVAKGVWPVSMHTPNFAKELQAIMAQHAPSQIALICATGGRSAYVTEVLEKNGVSGVFDVSEGMFGNGQSPGWIARGLPFVTLQEAGENYSNARADW